MFDLVPNNIPTPYHVIDIDKLRKNLSILTILKQRTGCKILYALKCFSNDLLFPYMNNILDGICASGLFEARLAKERFGNEVHTYSSAFSDSNIHEISGCSNYMTFNSVHQWNSFKDIAVMNDCKVGLRINPNYSEIANYNINPCHKHSRFGINNHDLCKIKLDDLDFVLFHNMCGQFSDTLERSTAVIINKFDDYLKSIKHINFGGGQLFTHNAYHLEDAIKCINNFREKYGISIYFEPGEAIIYDAAYLVTTIIDIVDNGIKTAILDTSALCHMPDIVFSKYHCDVLNCNSVKSKKMHLYRLSGLSCYAGDIFGDYSFPEPLEMGKKIVFKNSLNYTAVKSSMFNGIPYPSIVFYSYENGYKLMKKYDYETFLSII